MTQMAIRIEAREEQPAGRSASQQTGTRIFSGRLFRQHRQRVAFTEEAPALPPEVVRRPARVAVMLALAHKLEAAIDVGTVCDRAEVARRLGLTRARVTQLLDLTLLAPDIQEEVLGLEAVDGLEPVTERGLREVIGSLDWVEQRRRWAGVRRHRAGERSTTRTAAMASARQRI